MNVYNGFIVIQRPGGIAQLIGRNGGDRTAMCISAHDEGEARVRALAQMPIGVDLEGGMEVFTLLTIFSGVE